MQIAVISDIHGNFAALESVLSDIKEQGVDEVLVGGDLADGGRQPDAVLDTLMARKWSVVRGNSDRELLDIIAGKTDLSAEWLPCAMWTLDRLRQEHLAYLRALPTAIRREIPGGQLLLVHATPWSDQDVVFPNSPEDLAGKMLLAGQAEVLVYGHIHIPYYRQVNEGLLVSVGAVSWSNDQDPRPAYSILTFGKKVGVEVRRVAYDVEAEVTALDEVEHPLSTKLRRWLRAGRPWSAKA